MKLALLFFSLILLGSCSTKDSVQPKAEVEITVNNQTYRPDLSHFGNENCDFFFISISNGGKKDFPYRFSIKLTKKGDILDASLLSYKGGYYESALFNPKDFISIRDFAYDRETNSLSFAFESKLFLGTSANPINVQGRFNKLQLPSVACSVDNFHLLEAEVSSVTGKTTRFYSALSSGVIDDRMYRWLYFSNDGYRVVLENKTGLGNLALGTYNINSESASPVRVEFKQFVGQINKSNNMLLPEEEWQNYRVVGTLIVGRQVTDIHRKTYTYGRLSFTAYDENNQAVYAMKNGEFSVSSIR